MVRALDERPASIAVVRARTGLGDLLCTVPALRALRAHVPDAAISLVTYAEMAPVVERMAPWVDELVAFPGWPGIPERPPRPAAQRQAWAAAMGERGFDLALQAYGARPAAHEATLALGARRTAGFFAPGAVDPPDLVDWLPYPQAVHEVDRHLALLEHLGLPAGADRRLSFPVSEEERERAAALAPDAPFAVLHPGATSASRLWPAGRFAAVAEALHDRGLAVVVGGVEAERRLTAAVVEAARAPVVDLTGATDLGTYAALLSRAAVLAANDTGTAHLAAAVGCPSVTVFLSGDPRRWAGYGPAHRVARVQVECNPCEHLTCPIDHRCADRVTAEHVLAEAEALLAEG